MAEDGGDVEASGTFHVHEEAVKEQEFVEGTVTRTRRSDTICRRKQIITRYRISCVL